MSELAIEKDARLADISRKLVAARLERRALPGFPGALPETLGEAYQVQRLSRAAWPDRVAGWKVGGIPPQHASVLGSSHLVGPIYSRRLVRQDASRVASMPVFGEGFAAVEPEFVIMLGATRAEDRMFIGVEIASSPLPAINDIGPLAVVSDFGNNNGLLIGAEIANWHESNPQLTTIETVVDGEIVGSRSLPDYRQDVLAARDFALSLAEAEDLDMTPGMFVSTGAITGVHEAAPGSCAKLDFGRFGSLDLVLATERPE